MNTKEETIENFKIKYKKHIFSKNIKISLRQNDEILVTMPKFCPYKSGRDFLIQNFDKIKNFRTNLENKKEFLKPNLTTKFETLVIIEDKDSEETKTEVKKGIVYFYYPKSLDFNSNVIQKPLKEAYLKALKIEAKNYLPQRLDYLAEKYGFKYGKISIRNQKTRFGSCSFRNDISLNINLLKYDFDVIDYVLIHELCHTRIKNHSRKFWLEVEKYCPCWRELRKKLKEKS